MGGLAILPKAPAFTLTQPFPLPAANPVGEGRPTPCARQRVEKANPVGAGRADSWRGDFSSQLPASNPVTASPRGGYPDTRPDSRTAGGMVRIDPDRPFLSWHLWLGVSLPFGRMPAHQVEATAYVVQ